MTRKHVIVQENERLRMCSVQRDLEGCYRKLSHREAELQERISWLGEQVKSHKLFQFLHV
jgi:hypothetical protein